MSPAHPCALCTPRAAADPRVPHALEPRPSLLAGSVDIAVSQASGSLTVTLENSGLQAQLKYVSAGANVGKVDINFKGSILDWLENLLSVSAPQRLRIVPLHSPSMHVADRVIHCCCTATNTLSHWRRGASGS